VIEGLLNYQFLQNATAIAILASIACGIIGTVIMEKKMVMMSGGIAHTAFGGIGLGYFLGIEPIYTALGFSVTAAAVISKIHNRTRLNSDILIAMFWSLGMALGIIFIALTPGYPPDMTSYLFGDILTVSYVDLIITLVLDLILVFLLISYFNAFKVYLFDEEFGLIIGLQVKLIEYLTYIFIAVTVVVLIRVVGIILVIALLTVPPALSREFTFKLSNMVVISILLGMGFCVTGLIVSYFLDIPSGAAIIVLSVGSYLVSISVVKNLMRQYFSSRENVTSCSQDNHI